MTTLIATALPASSTLSAYSALPLATDLPEGIDVPDVIADVSRDGVSAPAGEVGDLTAVVDRAAEHGIQLSIVVLDRNPGRDSQLRDLATEVGEVEGGTVLVLSPNWVGTYSDSLSRVLLESGQDYTYTGNPVTAANNFVDEIVEPGLPWALLTAILIAIVVIASAATFVAKLRRTTKRRDETPAAGNGPSAAPAPPEE
ncbi:hypothetical protein BFN03_07635 [Rhodococcus sp. WMMA185]|uniref:Rv1476 family membrane protein n=1 Tax=Rhodococcus sp. WMMA185 TaxID=679318 RepID=UPI0008783283|nr:DUF6676 family protein [Rhodococcus sp. WMMA185]AOW92610.1 hypothetical protein BFN03_07635 [Rhodococcus sp. WMMA185]